MSVVGVLGDEIDPDPLGPDQPRHLFDLVHQRLGGVIEQQMSLVEEEHQLGLVRIADLGQFLEKLGQQPQQKSRIEPRRGHQRVGGEDVDLPAPVRRGAHEVREVQRRFAEKARRALVFQHQQAALDRTHRLHRDVAVAQGERVAVLSDPDQ